MDGPRIVPHNWADLEAAVREAIAARVPGWVNENVHDPGIALLELMAFLLEELVARRSIDPDRAARSVARIADSLSRLEGDETYEVSVDGERWNRVSTLTGAGPDDRVFSINEQAEVAFGDGRHGKRPEPGSRIAVGYRQGGGQQGNVALTVRTVWPLSDTSCEVTVKRKGTIGFICGPNRSV
jgi:hypothetical protein